MGARCPEGRPRLRPGGGRQARRATELQPWDGQVWERQTGNKAVHPAV